MFCLNKKVKVKRSKKMKKSMLVMLVALFIGFVLTPCALGAEAKDNGTKITDIEFQITYTTPYGVETTGEDGKPTVVYQLKTVKERPVLRIETKDGVATAYWLSISTTSFDKYKKPLLDKTPYFNGTRKQSFVLLPMAESEKVWNKAVDNKRHGIICLEYTVDRGALPPVKCVLSGHFRGTYLSKAISKFSGSGNIVGFGENDNSAFGIASDADAVQLPVYGTWNCSQNDERGLGNLRNSLKGITVQE